VYQGTAWQQTCYSYGSEGFPEYNGTTITTEGVENCVDIPLWGGKAKLTYKQTKPGCFTSCVDTEAAGKWEIEEEYCESGIKSVVKKDGKSMTEMWQRVVDENGFYVTCKTTNVHEFMKQQKMPEDWMHTLDDYKLCWKSCGDKIRMTEYFGDAMKVTFTSTLDHEEDYKWPIEGIPASKYCVTRTAPGKYTSVVKDAEGRESEWKFEFCGQGLKITGRDLKTGCTCCYEMVKQMPIYGKWKVISVANAKDTLKLLEVPEPMATELANDTSGTLCISHKGAMNGYKYCSKAFNVDVMFKWDEETCYFDPVLKANNTFVATQCGQNMIKSVSKNDKHNMIATMTFGENFMVEKCHLEGLECMQWTVIYKRCNE